MSSPQYLSLSDVAERYSLSRATIRRYIAAGTLPAYRLRGRSNRTTLRVRAEDAEALFVPVPATGGR